MGWLSSVLRMLAPIAVEHGGQVLRDSLKSRAAQRQGQPEGSAVPDPVQLIAADVDQLKDTCSSSSLTLTRSTTPWPNAKNVCAAGCWPCWSGTS